MTDDTRQSAGEPGATSGGSEIPAKPPEIVANMEWLRLHGRKHWRIVACALAVVLATWFISTPLALGILQSITNTLVTLKIEGAVKDLRTDYRKARDGLKHGTGNFSDVEKNINVILKLDPSNGHGLYYLGEVKRIRSTHLFDQQSCLNVKALNDKPQTLDTYQSDFNRYLDIERSLVDNERAGDYSAETCYQRASGYCPQRTAWIHHLLANDLYAEAGVVSNLNVRHDKLKRALAHAEAAERLYKDTEGNPGFRQCLATTALIAEANKQLPSAKP